LETIQGERRSTVDSKIPHYNVSCQTCRISKTFVTLQGANGFFEEHEGHQVIEGRLFETLRAPKEPEAIEEEVSKPQAEEPREAIASPSEVTVQELTSPVEEAPEVIVGPGEVVAQAPEPQAMEGADALAPVEAQAPLLQVVKPVETQAIEPVAAAPSLPSEEDIDEPLLLARSSYIGDSKEKRMDALRVSRALKEFKWNVEPPYVIGIMVDNNLSVETNIGVVSSSMVERVEQLGYKFVAVNAPQGSPVAWFKREARDAPGTGSPVGDADTMMQISHGKRTYDKDKAVWQESFVSLLMTVKDMDGQKLKHVTDVIKSEQPEPDLQS
jgi:hypothetical protein